MNDNFSTFNTFYMSAFSVEGMKASDRKQMPTAVLPNANLLASKSLRKYIAKTLQNSLPQVRWRGYNMSYQEHALSGERNSSAHCSGISKFSWKDSNKCKDEKSHSVTKIH